MHFLNCTWCGFIIRFMVIKRRCWDCSKKQKLRTRRERNKRLGDLMAPFIDFVHSVIGLWAWVWRKEKSKDIPYIGERVFDPAAATRSEEAWPAIWVHVVLAVPVDVLVARRRGSGQARHPHGAARVSRDWV